MPDARPFNSLRFGQYDEPPASSESSTPRTRRSRLHHALRATAAMDRAENDVAEYHGQSQRPAPRRSLLGPLQRRRQRSPGSSEPQDLNSSEETRRRRPKRRKLDNDLSPPPKQPIKYGHYGQVEPGKLKLEIISCDGGEHRDPRSPSTYLGPQNLLRHDKSVYCSERPTSGIVLRHADDTPFCLEKLHIVGPDNGFTAPVAEGLVYVSVSLNDLSKYMDPPPHARLAGVHSPPYRARRSFRTSPERISLADALRDPEVSAALDGGRDRDYASRAGAAHDASEEPYYGDDFGFGRQDPESHCDIPSSTDNPDILVTAEDENNPVAVLSDEDPGPEESTAHDIIDFRFQRMMAMRHRFEMANGDREERANGATSAYADGVGRRPRVPDSAEGSWGLRHLDAMMARSRMADSPQRDEPTEERDRSERHAYHPGSSSYYHASDPRGTAPESYDDGLNDPNVTHARFHIRRDKHKVAIKFDPPVSGRFILLKLWANRSNVDVQSVIAKGFGGSRFFPAIEFR